MQLQLLKRAKLLFVVRANLGATALQRGSSRLDRRTARLPPLPRPGAEPQPPHLPPAARSRCARPAATCAAPAALLPPRRFRPPCWRRRGTGAEDGG